MSLVQVITTSIPLAGEDLEGMAGSQYDGMVHNLMYGNQQGYQVSELSIQMKQFVFYLFLDEKPTPTDYFVCPSISYNSKRVRHQSELFFLLC